MGMTTPEGERYGGKGMGRGTGRSRQHRFHSPSTKVNQEPRDPLGGPAAPNKPHSCGGIGHSGSHFGAHDPDPRGHICKFSLSCKVHLVVGFDGQNGMVECQNPEGADRNHIPHTYTDIPHTPGDFSAINPTTHFSLGRKRTTQKITW